MRAQDHAAFNIERVVHRAGWVVFRRVECGEIVEVVLDFLSLGNGEADRVEQRLDAFDGAGNRVKTTDSNATSRKRDIERIRGKLAGELCFGERVAAAAERCFELGLGPIDPRSGSGTVRGRGLPQR